MEGSNCTTWHTRGTATGRRCQVCHCAAVEHLKQPRFQHRGSSALSRTCMSSSVPRSKVDRSTLSTPDTAPGLCVSTCGSCGLHRHTARVRVSCCRKPRRLLQAATAVTTGVPRTCNNMSAASSSPTARSSDSCCSSSLKRPLGTSSAAGLLRARGRGQERNATQQREQGNQAGLIAQALHGQSSPPQHECQAVLAQPQQLLQPRSRLVQLACRTHQQPGTLQKARPQPRQRAVAHLERCGRPHSGVGVWW